MDITLERILSLIPKKENGKFCHGAIAKFGKSIGLASGNVVSDWIAGRNSSYKKHIYEISRQYNVSVAWLTGETLDKNEKPAPMIEDGLSENISRLHPELAELLSRFLALAVADPESATRFLSFAVRELEYEQRAR